MFRFPLKIPGRTGSPQRERVEFDLPSKKPPGEEKKHELSVECMAINIMQWKYLRNVKKNIWIWKKHRFLSNCQEHAFKTISTLVDNYCSNGISPSSIGNTSAQSGSILQQLMLVYQSVNTLISGALHGASKFSSISHHIFTPKWFLHVKPEKGICKTILSYP